MTSTSSAADRFQAALKVDKLAQSSLLKHFDDSPSSSYAKLDAQLSYALSNSRAKGLPNIAIAPLQGQFLALQAQLIDAHSILEIGTLGGYSTIWFASTGAHVTSVEIDPHHRDVALENTRGQGFENVDIILGDAMEVLPRLASEGKKFDLIFIDADWELQWEFFEAALPVTRDRGCLYVDNVVREIVESGEVATKEGVAPKETLVQKVGRETRVDATLVSTVSSHKSVDDRMIDGFLLAIKKGGANA